MDDYYISEWVYIFQENGYGIKTSSFYRLSLQFIIQWLTHWNKGTVQSDFMWGYVPEYNA